jgi:PAS domain S-box-containing protein
MEQKKIANRKKNPARQKTNGAKHKIPASKMPLSLNFIKDEKQRLSALLDSIQDEVWFADKDRKLTLVNRAAVEEFGPSISEDKEVEKVAADLEVYRPDGTPRPVEEAPPLRALRGEIVRNQEEIVRTPATGELRHRQVSAAPVKDVDGSIVGSVSIVRDISDQKRAENQLRADLNALHRIRSLSELLLDRGGLQPLLQEIMDAAVEIMDAERGTLQLLEGNSLRIVAHHGHQQPFLEFFASAETRNSVCGEATRRGERVIVPDVEKSPLFAGTPSLQVLKNAGVRAVQSTPMRNRRGDLLGILTTQWDSPHTPDEHGLWRLDLLARQAADLLEYVESQEALHTNEERLALALSAGRLATWDWDMKRGEVIWNDEHFRILDYVPGEVKPSYQAWAERLHPDDRPEAEALFTRSIDQGGNYSGEYRAIGPDGTIRWIEARGHMDRDATGPTRSYGVLIDITDSKQKEEALRAHDAELKQIEATLRQSQQRLTALVQSAPVGIVIHGPDGRLLHSNPEAQKLLGILETEALGKDLTDPAWQFLREDGSVMPVEEYPVAQVLARQAPITNLVLGIPQGDPKDLVWLLVNAVPQLSDDGSVAEVIVTFTNISDRKRVEEALRETEVRFRTVLDNSRDGINMLDLKTGRYIFMSPAQVKITGFTAEELRNLSAEEAYERVHPEDREKSIFKQKLVAAGQDPGMSVEYRWKVKSGEYRWFNDSRGIVRDAQGQAVALVGVSRDITDRKKDEAALLESRKRFEVLTQNLDVGVALIDEHGQFVIVNPAFMRLFDLPSETDIRNINDRDWGQWQVVEESGELLDIDEHPVRKAAMTGRAVRDRLVGVRSPSGGSPKWMLISAEPVYRSDGRMNFLIATYHDITDLKRAKDVLRESEAKYRSLFQHMQEGFAYCQMLFDEDGHPEDFRYLAVNDSFGRLTGLENVIGRKVTEVIPGIKELNPELFEIYGRVALTGIPESFEIYFKPLSRDLSVSLYSPTKGHFAAVFDDITERKRNERDMARLASFPILNPSPIIEADLNGQVLFANPTAQKLFPDIQTRGLEHPFLADWGNLNKTSIGPENTRSRDVLVGEHWYSETVLYLEDVQKFRIYGLDITKRKQSEDALRQSEVRHRLLSETMLQGVVHQDASGAIVAMNPAAERILGKTREQFLGSSSMREERDTIREDGSPFPGLEHPAMVALRTGREVRGVIMGVRNPQMNDYRWISIDAVPVCRPGEMNPSEVYTVFVDITERKRAEEALRQGEELKRAAEVLASSEREFRLLAEAMPQMVWTTRSDGWNTYFNHQWVDYTGLTLEESYGHGWNKPFHPEDQERAWNAWENAVTNLASYALECRLRRADGVYRWWLIRGVPVLDAKGNVLKWFGTCTDIEDLKRAEEALRQANAGLEQRAAQLRALAGELTLSEQRERSRLAKVLHDHLQQLLVAAKFRLAILGKGSEDLMKQAIKEVEELIDESIVSSRSLTAELSPPILHAAGLNAGLEWLARRMADRQGLMVDLELEDTGPLPDDLKILLFESVRELLFNVAKHAHTRSATVNLRRVDGSLQLGVSDQGEGFDPSVMAQAGESVGFGLFTVRERLELFGGKLEIQSSPGQGSRVFLSVPMTPPTSLQPRSTPVEASPGMSISERIPESIPSRKIRVLLVDDHAVVRQGIGNMLNEELDIEVVAEAADGQEAVELAAKLLPDVILMDMNLPKLNGIEATRAIHEQHPAIRIIGLSMFEETERAQAMCGAGAVSYLTKSGAAEALIATVRKHGAHQG